MPSPLRSPSDGNASVSFSGNARRNDGNMDVVLAEDAMSATAILYPPMGDGAPLTQDYAAEMLARLGITVGVQWESLTERILEANTDRRVIHDVLVAQGIRPVSEHPEHVVIEEKYRSGWQPIDDDQNTVDWKSRSPVLIVRKGERIGRVEARRDGTLGTDVTGKPIAFARDQVTNYALGKNVERAGDDIVASTEGRVVIDAQRISVEEVLTIKGDVDYRVGHVLFPGDVVIEGGVAAGFKVYSGGSITIKETMDAFDVNCKRDLSCAQGIIGKELGHVRVGGTLKAKFVENARVAVRGDAQIPGSLVASKLFTLGKLYMGDKGRIVGGEVFATHGVSCGYLGGATRPTTVINVGMDFTVQQKLDQANAILRELGTRLARFDAMLKSRQDDALRRARDETAEKIRTLSSNIVDLSQRVDIDESAIVEVRNAVYPGVVIVICHIRISVEEPLKKARFSLDKTAKRIVIER